jgi:hypothetical protein
MHNLQEMSAVRRRGIACTVIAGHNQVVRGKRRDGSDIVMRPRRRSGLRAPAGVAAGACGARKGEVRVKYYVVGADRSMKQIALSDVPSSSKVHWPTDQPGA